MTGEHITMENLDCTTATSNTHNESDSATKNKDRPYVDPYKHQKKYMRKRYTEDADYRAKCAEQRLAYERKRYATDPEYRAAKAAHARKYRAAKKMKDTAEK